MNLIVPTILDVKSSLTAVQLNNHSCAMSLFVIAVGSIGSIASSVESLSDIGPTSDPEVQRT